MSITEIRDYNRRLLNELLAPTVLRRAIALQELEQHVRDQHALEATPVPKLTPSWVNPYIEMADGKARCVRGNAWDSAAKDDFVCVVCGVAIMLFRFEAEEDIRKHVWRLWLQRAQELTRNSDARDGSLPQSGHRPADDRAGGTRQEVRVQAGEQEPPA